MMVIDHTEIWRGKFWNNKAMLWCLVMSKLVGFSCHMISTKSQTIHILWLCPSPTVPNLFPNEDEWTIRVYPGCHSWSFQSIPIHSNSVLLVRVGLAGEYESFEHVQKLRVASTNNFHSCLMHWQHVAIVFATQLTYSILVIRTIFLLYSGCSYCILGHSYCRWDWDIRRMDKKTVRMEMECAAK